MYIIGGVFDKKSGLFFHFLNLRPSNDNLDSLAFMARDVMFTICAKQLFAESTKRCPLLALLKKDRKMPGRMLNVFSCRAAAVLQMGLV